MHQAFTSLLLPGLLLSTAALAASDPIEQRQDLMENTKEAAGTIGKMLKGKEPFDAANAMAALQAWHKTATEVGDLFPAGSETGHDTEAKSEIWTDRAGFDQKLSDFGRRVDEAIAANPATLAELGAAVDPVFKACKACHETYRAEKD